MQSRLLDTTRKSNERRAEDALRVHPTVAPSEPSEPLASANQDSRVATENRRALVSDARLLPIFYLATWS